MKTNKKRFSVLLAAFTVCLATFIGPASALADKPLHTMGSDEFSDLDPCTGNLHQLTLFFDFFEHQGHEKNFVAHVIRSGFTDSGYELFAGNLVSVSNGHVDVFWFKDMWRNDDGRMMEVSLRGVFNLNQGTVNVDRFVFRCIGGETIVP